MEEFDIELFVIIMAGLTVLFFGSLYSYGYFDMDVVGEVNKLNCNSNLKAYSYCSEGQRYTLATPDHQRPCNQPILFGGSK
jgi:hypothetical protein